MGQAVSCVDASREELPPPYSWPKDHPGRAAAIELINKRSQEGKPVGSIAHFAPGAQRAYIPERTFEDDEVGIQVVQDTITPNAARGENEYFGTSTLQDSRAAALDTTSESQEGNHGRPSGSKTTGEDEQDREGGMMDSTYVDGVPKVPDGDLKLEKLEKEHFSLEADKLPEVKDVEQRVRDPITNEMVSHEEFRRSVVTKGVVQEQVSKFETIDEKAALEKAEYTAQHLARTSLKKTPSIQSA